MAHESKFGTTNRPAVAGETILEGKLVRLTASGVKDDLPVGMLAASGTTLNVYVAFVAPDEFSRPTPGAMYTAGRQATFYEGNPWVTPTLTDTFYYNGLSTFENPVLSSGYVMIAKRGGIYEVPSGCTVPSANLKVVGNLAKVSDDGTGRFESTSSESVAVAKVVDWNPATETYTFEMLGK